jgi:uncharacterized protein YvpB
VSRPSSQDSKSRAGRRRAVFLSAVATTLVAVLVVSFWSSPAARQVAPAEDGTVVVTVGKRAVFSGRVDELRPLSGRQLARRLRRLGARSVKRGRSEIELRTNTRVLAGEVRRAIDAGGGTVGLRERPVSASSRLPVVRQALRNNCETAALSMLLAARDIEVPQLELQRSIRRSGPLDPGLDSSGEPALWGDPREGYVGRADGGGTSGGYGAYEKPVQALARRRGADLADLSGSEPERIYRRLLTGRPVMVWIGLTDGPYKTWRTPRGDRVTGNFGEHTVVLTGLRGDTLELNDPLVGRRTTWTRDEFEQMWQRLGRRAISA